MSTLKENTIAFAWLLCIMDANYGGIMKKWLLSQGREPSTWRGVVMILTSLGIVISPDTQDAIISVGLAISGLIGVIFSDETSSS